MVLPRPARGAGTLIPSAQRLAGLSSALAFPLDLGARPLCRRLRGRGCANCQSVDVVWGLPRCVWARESTAPAQGIKEGKPGPTQGTLRAEALFGAGWWPQSYAVFLCQFYVRVGLIVVRKYSGLCTGTQVMNIAVLAWVAFRKITLIHPG